MKLHLTRKSLLPIFSMIALLCAADAQKPSHDSKTQKFLREIPKELSFLKAWSCQKPTIVTVSSYEAGRNPLETTKKFWDFTFHTIADPQKIAHELKARLSAKKGWKLSFPEVGRYSARASRQRKDGVIDYMLHFMDTATGPIKRPTSGQVFLVIYDASKPIKS